MRDCHRVAVPLSKEGMMAQLPHRLLWHWPLLLQQQLPAEQFVAAVVGSGLGRQSRRLIESPTHATEVVGDMKENSLEDLFENSKASALFPLPFVCGISLPVGLEEFFQKIFFPLRRLFSSFSLVLCSFSLFFSFDIVVDFAIFVLRLFSKFILKTTQRMNMHP